IFMSAIKRFIPLLAILLFCLNSSGQERTVTGVVVSSDNTPIEGVSVIVKGATTGTQTGPDGSFSISAASGQVLEFSSVGFESQQYTVRDAGTIRITLSTSNTSMEDIVVVGYGTQRRGNVTGAVSTVDVRKTLQGRPIADVGRGLQGAAS